MNPSTWSLIGAVVGAAAAYFTGNPGFIAQGAALGATIGGVIGALTYSPDPVTQFGSRLSDIRPTTSQYGTPIPYIWGAMRVPGVVAWMPNLTEEETRNTPPGTNTVLVEYIYRANVFVLLCKGTTPGDPAMTGVRKIWADGKLILDRSVLPPEQYGSFEFIEYLGGTGQTADPTMESYEGAGNVPTYRGYGAVLLKNFVLTPYGNRLPNLNFEVVTTTGTAAEVVTTIWGDVTDNDTGVSRDTDEDVFAEFAVRILNRGIALHQPSGTDLPANTTSPQIQYIDLGLVGRDSPLSNFGGYMAAVDGWDPAVMSIVDVSIRQPNGFHVGATVLWVLGWNSSTKDLTAWQFNGAVASMDLLSGPLLVQGSVESPDGWIKAVPQDPDACYVALTDTISPHLNVYYVTTSATTNIYNGEPIANHRTCVVDDAGYLWTPLWPDDTGWPNDKSVVRMGSNGVRTEFPISSGWGASAWGITGMAFDNSTALSGTSRLWISLMDVSSEKFGIEVYEIDYPEASITSMLFSQYTYGTVLFDEDFHTIRFNHIRKTVLFASQRTTTLSTASLIEYDCATFAKKFQTTESRDYFAANMDYGSTGRWILHIKHDVYAPFSSEFAWLDFNVLTPDTVSIGRIVTDICVEAGYDESQIDVTELTQTINGYMFPGGAPAREALTQLMRIGRFDAVEKDGQLVFLTRGRSTTRTLTDADIGYGDKEDSEPAVLIERNEEQSLPHQIEVGYYELDSDYQMELQRSRRLAGNASDLARVDFPVVITNDQAKIVSDVILYSTWEGRESITFTAWHAHLDLLPTAVVLVQYDGREYKVRITRTDIGVNWSVKIFGVIEDTAPYAAWDAPETSGGGSIGGGTAGGNGTGNGLLVAEAFEAPMILTDRNGPEVWIAAYALGGGTFPTTIVQRTQDGGTTWQTVASITTEAAVGAVAGTLGDGRTDQIDAANFVDVTFLGNRVPVSVTVPQMLNGSNLLLVGEELIAFADVTLISGATYRLSTLMRGLRGTEWATSTHTLGERAYLMDGGPQRILLDTADIGTTLSLRYAQIDGTSFTNLSIDYQGVNMTPLAVVFTSGANIL